MSKAEQIEPKKIGRIKLSDNQDLIASAVGDKKFKLSIKDRTRNDELELCIVDENKNNQKKKESWLFGSLTILFGWLVKWTTLYGWVRACCPKARTRRNSDMWILGNVILAIALWIIMPHFGYTGWVGYHIMVLAIWRIHESVVVSMNSALFGGKDILSHERRVVYALITYVGLSFWFAILYMKFHRLFGSIHIELRSSLGSWYFSVATMSTLGYGDIFPTKEWGGFIAACQTMVGIVFAVIVIGSFISSIKQPESPSK